jgi:hypothetical protein
MRRAAVGLQLDSSSFIDSTNHVFYTGSPHLYPAGVVFQAQQARAYRLAVVV